MTDGDSSVPLGDVARALLAEAERRGLTLRLGGSLAVREHCPGTGRLLERWNREAPADIDLFGYHSEQHELEQMFDGLGYSLDPAIAYSQEYGVNRLIYHGAEGTKVDIFLDALRMAHAIDLKDRLQSDSPTLSLADLVLTKLQIHEFTVKDVQDLAALLTQHDLSDGREPEAIEVPRVVTVLASDWGFWYTAAANLDTTARFLEGEAQGRHRLEALRERIDGAPKGAKWRMRARIGTRVKWYEDVQTVEQGGF